MTWAEWLQQMSVADVTQFIAIGWIARELWRVTIEVNKLGAQKPGRDAEKEEG